MEHSTKQPNVLRSLYDFAEKKAMESINNRRHVTFILHLMFFAY